MLALFQKKSLGRFEKYKLGESVPFETAYSALREGYVIKHANYSNIYYIMFNSKVFSLNIDPIGHQSPAHMVEEFSLFEMQLHGWKVFNANILGDKEILD